jgi:hypothetical protein
MPGIEQWKRLIAKSQWLPTTQRVFGGSVRCGVCWISFLPARKAPRFAPMRTHDADSRLSGAPFMSLTMDCAPRWFTIHSLFSG